MTSEYVMKKLLVLTAVFVVIATLAIVNIFLPCLFIVPPEHNLDLFQLLCEQDSDCVIKEVECEQCNPTIACSNEDWVLFCDPEENVTLPCPPSPPWVTTCKCVNSMCVDCRDIFPVPDGIVQCVVDGSMVNYNE